MLSETTAEQRPLENAGGGLRVVSLSTRFHGGGAERAARDIFLGLRSSGVDVEMFVAKRDVSEPPEVKSIRYPGEKYLRAVKWVIGETDACFPGSWVALRRIDRSVADVVHIHNIHSEWVAISAVQNLARRMPLVWSLHDEWSVTNGYPYDLRVALQDQRVRDHFGNAAWRHDPGRPETAGRRQFLRQRMPKPIALISPSHYLARLAAANEHLGSASSHVIPYGLPMLANEATRLPRQEAKRRLGIPADKTALLIIAAHFTSPYKGMWLAEEMCRHLVGGDFHLVVAGRDGEEFARRSGLQATPLGYLRSDEELATAYRASDVTVVPSIADNFPYVALESLACETPIVCFGVGGLAEIAGRGERGYVATPYDPVDLARGVHRLGADAEHRHALGRAGRRWVEANCGMEEYLQRIRRVYRQAIDDHWSRRGGLHRPSRWSGDVAASRSRGSE